MSAKVGQHGFTYVIIWFVLIVAIRYIYDLDGWIVPLLAFIATIFLALILELLPLWLSKRYPLRWYSFLLLLLPRSASYRYSRGVAYLKRKQYKLALLDFGHAIHLKPDFANTYFVRAATYTGLERYQDAFQDYDTAIRLKPDFANAYFRRGWIYQHYFHDYERAIQDYSRMIELSPGSAHAYKERGLAYLRLKAYQRALDDYNEALKHSPRWSTAYGQRAYVYVMLGEYQRALQDVEEALACCPENATLIRAWILTHCGWIYSCLAENERALECANQAIELAPDFAGGYSTRGSIYGRLGDYRRALQDYDEALLMVGCLDNGDFNVRLLCERCLIYIRLKDYPGALREADLVVRQAPEKGQAYAARGLVYLCLQDVARAREDFVRGWGCSPKSSLCGFLLAWLDMGAEWPGEEMAGRLDEIAASEPEEYTADLCRGVALVARGDLEMALPLLQRANKREPDYAETHFWLGMAYASLKRDTEALEALRQAFRLALPRLLERPLRWFEQERPDFYAQQLAPLLAAENEKNASL